LKEAEYGAVCESTRCQRNVVLDDGYKNLGLQTDKKL
jgi:hypothetical protein